MQDVFTYYQFNNFSHLIVISIPEKCFLMKSIPIIFLIPNKLQLLKNFLLHFSKPIKYIFFPII